MYDITVTSEVRTVHEHIDENKATKALVTASTLTFIGSKQGFSALSRAN
jgi:hypothetical protein